MSAARIHCSTLRSILRSALLAAPAAALCATGCLAADDSADLEAPAAASTQAPQDGESIVIPPGPDEGGPHPRAAAPSCLVRTLVFTRLLNIDNECSTTKWVKVIVDLGPDSSCFSIAAHRIANVSWSWPGTYGGLVSC